MSYERMRREDIGETTEKIIRSVRSKGFPKGYSSESRLADRATEFYDWVRRRGLQVYRTSHKFLRNTFGNYLGWRDGDTIYVAMDDGERLLRPAEQATILGHELCAGHDHINSDREAQRRAIDLFSETGEFPYRDAHDATIRMGRERDLL